MVDKDQTNPDPSAFDFSKFPADTLFHERRTVADRRFPNGETPEVEPRESRPKPERRAKKERRRRIDPTTFEKQYTDDELEFMNAMQQFKVQSCKSFPSHGDVLRVAFSLGYRRPDPDKSDETFDPEPAGSDGVPGDGAEG